MSASVSIEPRVQTLSNSPHIRLRPWHQPSCGAVTICYRYKLLVLWRTSYFRRHSSTAGSLQRLAQANVGAAPAYLADDCRLLSDVGRRPLPSNSNDIPKLLVPRTHNKLGDMSFSAAGPRLWNDLPPGLRRPGLTFNSFRQSLKTHLFGDRSASIYLTPLLRSSGCMTASRSRRRCRQD